jgi:hypothetical protein
LGKDKAPNDPSPPFKEKEKGGEGRSKLGGQWNVPMLGGQWNVKEKNTFSPLRTFPHQTYLNLQFFSFDLEV